MSEQVKNNIPPTPTTFYMLCLTLKLLDGIWAENKHEESQNNW